MNSWKCYVDGSSLGNPGYGSAGVVIYKNGESINHSEYFGKSCTNNEAEYQALITALQFLKNHNMEGVDVTVYMDSALVVNQVNGNWKVSSQSLKPLCESAIKEVESAGFNIHLQHIGREKNEEANKIAQDRSRKEKERNGKSGVRKDSKKTGRGSSSTSPKKEQRLRNKRRSK